MPDPPFVFANPLGPASPDAALIEPPPAELGPVAFGYSTLSTKSASGRPWWHPLKNPVLTGGLMLIVALFSLGAAQEGAHVAAIVFVLGYLATKGLGALVKDPPVTNFFVGANGMFDVTRHEGQTSRRTVLWKDIEWWGTTPERVNGLYTVRHVQLDPSLRLLTHVNPFGFRFTRDPATDPESAMYVVAHRAWLEHKLSQVAHRLASGAPVDMPLLATQNAGRLATGVRPSSFVRLTPDQLTVVDSGTPVFNAPRAATTLRWDHRPSPARPGGVDAHCILQSGPATWSIARYELPGGDVLAKLVRVAE